METDVNVGIDGRPYESRLTITEALMDVRMKADGCLQRYLLTSLQTLTDVNKCSDGRQYES